MDTEYYNNPLYNDEKIIASKIGLTDYPDDIPTFSLDNTLKLEIVRDELKKSNEKNEQLMKQLKTKKTTNYLRDSSGSDEEDVEGDHFSGLYNKLTEKITAALTEKNIQLNKKAKREHFVGSGDDANVQHYQPDDLGIFGERRTLIFIIFVMFTFIIAQHMSYKSDMNTMMMNMNMYRMPPGVQVAAPGALLAVPPGVPSAPL